MKKCMIFALLFGLFACVEPEGDVDVPGDEVVDGPCVYPESTGVLGLGATMPNLTWDEAEGWDGPFSLEEVYCQKEYKSIAFVLTANWCPTCPAYMQHVARSRSPMEDNDTLVVFVSTQLSDFTPATTQDASSYYNGRLDEGFGVRVGDATTSPSPIFNEHIGSLFSFMPNALIVRTSDMKVVHLQEGMNENQWADFAGITSNIDAPNPSDVPLRCGLDDEESSEPNSNYERAHLLSEGDVVSGGLCTPGSFDLYEVNVAGAWEVDLRFEHALGDLEISTVNAEGGLTIAPNSPTDNELLVGNGPAYFIVYGYNGQATAPYELTFSRL